MIIMRGLPGSGKSYKAKLLAHIGNAERGYVTPILSTDQYFVAGGFYVFDRDKLGHAHQWNQWRAEQLCRVGKNLIIDNTNTTWCEIKPYVEIAIKYGYDIELHIPRTTWAWDVDKCTKRNSHGTPREVVECMRDRFTLNRDIERSIQKHWKEANIS